MAWRMVMRRCPMRSMTLVGDLAQTSDPAGASSWARVLRPYARQGFRVEELTVNYRTPAEIMTVAEPVLAAIDPGPDGADIRSGCRCSPTHRRSEPPSCLPRWPARSLTTSCWTAAERWPSSSPDPAATRSRPR